MRVILQTYPEHAHKGWTEIGGTSYQIKAGEVVIADGFVKTEEAAVKTTVNILENLEQGAHEILQELKPKG